MTGLTLAEERRLSLWKYRYTYGFTREELERLLFLRWLYHTGRIAS